VGFIPVDERTDVDVQHHHPLVLTPVVEATTTVVVIEKPRGRQCSSQGTLVREKVSIDCRASHPRSKLGVTIVRTPCWPRAERSRANDNGANIVIGVVAGNHTVAIHVDLSVTVCIFTDAAIDAGGFLKIGTVIVPIAWIVIPLSMIGINRP
jgi:hypothetical protein